MDRGYRTVKVMDAEFHYRVRPLETDFLFADGSVKTFANWDVKGLRERCYMEEYVSIPVEDYLRMTLPTGETVEYGVKMSDVKKFIEDRSEYFEELLIEAANNISLEG